ncbi:MAG: ferritin family protein [Methyloceanibacter sp.]
MPESSQEARYRANLQGEVDGAHLYRTLSEVEPNPQIAGIYGRLAAVEDGHAQLWKKQVEALGKRVPEPWVSWRTRTRPFWLADSGPDSSCR